MGLLLPAEVGMDLGDGGIEELADGHCCIGNGLEGKIHKMDLF